MARLESAVSAAILVLLTFISLILAAYASVFCYSFLKKRRKSQTKTRWPDGKLRWLDKERSPLIPGNFSAQPVQPTPSHSDDEEVRLQWHALFSLIQVVRVVVYIVVVVFA